VADDTEADYDRLIALRVEQEARRAREVLNLLSGRGDLRGVHAMADMVGEQALWCA